MKNLSGVTGAERSYREELKKLRSEGGISKRSRKLSEIEELKDLLIKVGWDVDKLFEYVEKVSGKLGARVQTKVKIETKLSICCRDFIK